MLQLERKIDPLLPIVTGDLIDSDWTQNQELKLIY